MTPEQRLEIIILAAQTPVHQIESFLRGHGINKDVLEQWRRDALSGLKIAAQRPAFKNSKAAINAKINQAIADHKRPSPRPQIAKPKPVPPRPPKPLPTEPPPIEPHPTPILNDKDPNYVRCPLCNALLRKKKWQMHISSKCPKKFPHGGGKKKASLILTSSSPPPPKLSGGRKNNADYYER